MARPRNANRRERTTFGQMRSQLKLDDKTVEKIKGMKKVARWVNDDNGGARVKELYDRGYDFMNAEGTEIIGDPDGGYQPPEAGSHMSKHVGMTKTGEPMRAYLMVTDQANYDEDKAAKEAINAQVDEAIRGGNAPGSEKTSERSDRGSTYVKEVKYKP